MESFASTLAELREGQLGDKKSNLPKFQNFIADYSKYAIANPDDVDLDFVKELAEYSKSPHFLTIYKHKDLNKNLVKRCVVEVLVSQIQHKNNQEGFLEKMENILSLKLSNVQTIELVRALHFYYPVPPSGDLPTISELYSKDECVLLGSPSEATMTASDLHNYSLPYEFNSRFSLQKLFKNKTVDNVPKLADTLKVLIDAIIEFHPDLEPKLFTLNNAQVKEDCVFSQDLTSFAYSVLPFCISNHASCSEGTLEALLIKFVKHCSNVKIMSNLKHQCSEVGMEETAELIQKEIDRALQEEESKEELKSESDTSSKITLNKVFNRLFNLAIDQKTSKDKLSSEALSLFEQLASSMEIYSKTKLNKLPSLAYRYLDSKVGGKLTMPESKAWSKIIVTLYSSGICSNQVEMDVLIKKVERFTSKQSIQRDKKKMKREIRRQHQEKVTGIDVAQMYQDKLNNKDWDPSNKKYKNMKKKNERYQKERKKAQQILSQYECKEGCKDGCICDSKNMSKALKEYKEKVEGYYENKREEMQKSQSDEQQD